jgi:hypothetical protein
MLKFKCTLVWSCFILSCLKISLFTTESQRELELFQDSNLHVVFRYPFS